MNHEVIHTIVQFASAAAKRMHHNMAFSGMMDFLTQKRPHVGMFVTFAKKIDFPTVIKTIPKPFTLFVVCDEGFREMRPRTSLDDQDDFLFQHCVPGVILTDMIVDSKQLYVKAADKQSEISLSRNQDGQIVVNGTSIVLEVLENFRDGSIFIVDKALFL